MNNIKIKMNKGDSDVSMDSFDENDGIESLNSEDLLTSDEESDCELKGHEWIKSKSSCKID